MRTPRQAQPLGEIGLRLDQNAGPAGLLELPALRAALRIVGADLDEKAAPRVGEEFVFEAVLKLVGKHRTHAGSVTPPCRRDDHFAPPPGCRRGPRCDTASAPPCIANDRPRMIRKRRCRAWRPIAPWLALHSRRNGPPRWRHGRRRQGPGSRTG